MAEQWQIDLALMAGRAYQSSRPDENKLPVPDAGKEGHPLKGTCQEKII